MKTNKEMYSTWEFNRWAYGVNLDRDDKFLFANYLDKNRKTVEAGTGGGRLVLGLQELGFKSLYGFDFVPELIETAKSRDKSHRICFEVQDATNLGYESQSFDQIVYLQNIISSIDEKEKRSQALKRSVSYPTTQWDWIIFLPQF
ncbi:MAG: class I SAM-dependent methyltransferase [Desertifilum sp.]|nr:class I SAM-dependent methyltransferase [Desertifilum sp.]